MVTATEQAVAELKLRLQADLKPSPSPWPPWPDADTLAQMIVKGGTPALHRIAELHAARERSIRLAKADPFTHGWEWDCWQRADRYLPTPPWASEPADGIWRPLTAIRILTILGGNRASKSEWSIKRSVQSLCRFPRTRLIFLSQKLETSRQIQQEYVWRYMPAHLRALNYRKDPSHNFYIRYQKGTGFSEGKFVLPNGSEGIFLVYTQNPSDYEGIQIGCPDVPGVIGWNADESLPLDWLQLLTTRSATFDAAGLWTFTALEGMTPALKETKGLPKVVESRMAAALAERQNLPDIPLGHMPTVETAARPNIIVVYFHTDENPVGGYARVLADCEGKPTYFKERKLYGYVRDVKGKVFTHFGEWNLVDPTAVPKVGTRYMHCDPAGRRNWFMLWALVDPEERIWIYDEWPTVDELGEWAVTTTRDPAEGGHGWDGDRGPAQESAGYGTAQYKALMLRKEAATGVVPNVPPVQVPGSIGAFGRLLGLRTPLDQHPGNIIVRRTVDRRAGPSPIPQAMGEQTCTLEELQNEQRDSRTGEIVGPALEFQLAGGPGLEDDGLEMIKEALWVDREKPLDPLRNFPRLFVSKRCQNLIWAMQNYTGRDGQKGACKDPIDCLRDLFTSGLEHQTPSMYGSQGGGSY